MYVFSGALLKMGHQHLSNEKLKHNVQLIDSISQIYTATVSQIFESYLSETSPEKNPPNATPNKNIISATCFNCSLSQTKFH